MADEKDNVILLKETVKDVIENNEIVIDARNAQKLINLKKVSEEIQKQFNVITGVVLDMHGASGKYNTVFNMETNEVKLVREKSGDLSGNNGRP